MDLLSLPEEMLASVLKYSNVPNMTKYRQINSKVNRITVRNRLNEHRLKKLSFTIRDKTIEVRAETTRGFKCTKHYQFTREDRDETLYEVVQNTYLKVRYTRLFEINNCRQQRMELPNRIINMLIDNSKKRQISGLSLFNLFLDIDLTLIRQLLTSFNIEHFSLSYCKSPNLGQVCSLFDGLSLEYLLFKSTSRLRDIKMKCKNNITENLWVRCKDISLKEAVNLFVEDVVDRREKNVNLSLYGLRSGGLHADAIEDILEPLGTHGIITIPREQLYTRACFNHIIIFLRF